MAYVVWLGVISCGGAKPPPAHVPVAAPCSDMRIGKVLVSGAASTDVPALAVLAGTIEDPPRTNRIVAAATDALRFRGFTLAEIAVSRKVGCFVDLQVAVSLGPKFRIANILFATTDEFPASERLAVIEDALGTVNTIGGVYIEYRFVRGLAVLERRYHDAGWLDAKLAAPTATYDEHSNVTITVPVKPGHRYRIGAIRARGAGAAARAAVLEEIQVEPGGWYDGPAIRHGIERARRRIDRGVELRTSVSADTGAIELEAVLESR